MDLDNAIVVISALLGSGGIVAFMKAKSEVRNANKSADIEAFKATIEVLQNSYKELQDRYQDNIIENETRCDKLAGRLTQLEVDYDNSVKRITELEIELQKANNLIATLQEQIYTKNSLIDKLQRELDKQCKTGLLDK